MKEYGLEHKRAFHYFLVVIDKLSKLGRTFPSKDKNIPSATIASDLVVQQNKRGRCCWKKMEQNLHKIGQ